MKKIISFVLAAMFVLSLSACVCPMHRTDRQVTCPHCGQTFDLEEAHKSF